MEKGKFKRNEVIVWDKIVKRKYIKDFKLTNQKLKYKFTDINNKLRGKVVTVNFWIEHVPVFGWIHRVR